MKVNKGRTSKTWKCKEKLKKTSLNSSLIDCDLFTGFDLAMVAEGAEAFLKMQMVKPR